MRVLVTGGAGFIGSHLIENFLKEPDISFIRVVDNYFTGKRENLEPFLSHIECIEGDLLQDTVREQVVQGIDVIFHEAAIPSVSRSVEAPIEAHANGSHLTVLLLESARRAGVRRVVFAGSSSVYGDTLQLPKSEDMLPTPLSPYAATKLACELYAHAFARCYPIDTVTLRYFNVFGPRQDPSSPYSGVIARFCLAFCRNEPLTVYGDGEQTRDFTYVANVVRANLLAARHPDRLGGDVFNIGTGERISLNGLIELLNEITHQQQQVRYQSKRPGDVQNSLADIRKARDRLQYRPLISIREGLSQTLAWYRASVV
jgi:nucleoside-diphosphate-sugar epimerase